MLLLFNASDEEVSFTLPPAPVAAGPWRVRVDTSDDALLDGRRRVPAEEKYELPAHAMAVLTQALDEERDAKPA